MSVLMFKFQVGLQINYITYLKKQMIILVHTDFKLSPLKPHYKTRIAHQAEKPQTCIVEVQNLQLHLQSEANQQRIKLQTQSSNNNPNPTDLHASLSLPHTRLARLLEECGEG